MSQQKRKKVIGAFFGTIVEYYDYSLYGFSAGILATKFFPNMDKITSLMYVFSIYALSYFAKPLGSLMFSRIGDKYGRKIALKITILGIAVPTVIIGILPEYESIGVLSTYILIVCRLLQGFFVAGEYDGAAIYVIEHLGKEYHYTASAITRMMGVIGLLLGIATTNFFNSSIFPDWAWRIPFLLSLPLALFTIYYRQFLEETPDFKCLIEQNIEFTGLLTFIKKCWKPLIMTIFLAGGFGVTYQVAIIFMNQYLPLVMPQTSIIMTSFSVIIVFVFGITMPIAGLCADKFGKIIVLKISLLLSILASISLAIAIYYQVMNLALMSCLILAVAVAPCNALAHGVIIKSFPINERYRGVGLGHTTGSMLMSGTANYICLLCIKTLNLTLFPIIYIGFFAILAFIMITMFMKLHQE